MVKYLFVILFIILTLSIHAQSSDSMFVVRKAGNWAIKYTVKPGETLHMLALRFYIPDVQLEYSNEADVIKKFSDGSVIYIPVTPDNYFVQKQTFRDQREIYYHVGQKDDISTISTYAGVTRAQIRSWNSLKGNSLVPEQALFVGWVKYMNHDTSNPATELAYPSLRKKVAPDTVKMRVLGGLDTVFNRQTNYGSDVITEKGTAVFFDQRGSSKEYYALHNAIPKGSVIKVFNPGTGKTTYVKVIGPLPETKKFANSIIGICSAAKDALGVTEEKAWCELSYSPN